MSNAGIPIKVLHEADGHPVTVELKNGEVYRGVLADSEDNMNCRLTGVTVLGVDGRMTKLEQVYLRGSQVRFFILPNLLQHAPIFKKVQQVKAATEKKKADRLAVHHARGK